MSGISILRQKSAPSEGKLNVHYWNISRNGDKEKVLSALRCQLIGLNEQHLEAVAISMDLTQVYSLIPFDVPENTIQCYFQGNNTSSIKICLTELRSDL